MWETPLPFPIPKRWLLQNTNFQARRPLAEGIPSIRDTCPGDGVGNRRTLLGILLFKALSKGLFLPANNILAKNNFFILTTLSVFLQ